MRSEPCRRMPASLTMAPAPGAEPAQSTDSVATSFQFGSRELTSRAKVQMSVTSPTWIGSPSITVPLLSWVAEISLERKRTVICAVPFLSDARR